MATAPFSTNPTPSPDIVRRWPPVMSVSNIGYLMLRTGGSDACIDSWILRLPPDEYGKPPGFEGAIDVLETGIPQPGQLITHCARLVECHPRFGTSHTFIACSCRANGLVPAPDVSLIDFGGGSEYLLSIDEESTRSKRIVYPAKESLLFLVAEMMYCQRRNHQVP